MNPLVSIITVVFNGAKTLEQTIQSVLGQSYQNIEYIIVDGGSTDGTLEIIRKYEDRIARWVSEPDDGLYDAMNKGIRMASGELIGIINSDDWYEPNAVQLIVDAYCEHPDKRIFHGDRHDILPDGTQHVRRFHPSRMKFLYYGTTYNHPSMFVHQNIYKEGNYNRILRALSDYEFILKNFIKHEGVFLYIPQAYVNYRLEGVSSRTKLINSLVENWVARKNAGMGLLGRCLAVVIRVCVAVVYRARRMLLKGKF